MNGLLSHHALSYYGMPAMCTELLDMLLDFLGEQPVVAGLALIIPFKTLEMVSALL
jgi:hypothetical protein